MALDRIWNEGTRHLLQASGLMGNRHVQTLTAAMPFHSPPVGFAPDAEETLLPGLPDGSKLSLKAWWHRGNGAKPTVLLVHGIGGSIESRYMMRAAVGLYKAGFHVVRMNMRGAGESFRQVHSLYHAGLTDDLNVALGEVAALPKVDALHVLGFSLGGQVSLKAAGEWGRQVPAKVTSVATVSAPLDLDTTSTCLESPETWPYRRYILRGLIMQALRFKRIRPERAPYRRTDVLLASTVRAYDDVVIAPMHGFANAAAYYAATSAGQFLPGIAVPTLMIHAEDDPMVPAFTLKPALENKSPFVHNVWTAEGGHVGFVEGFEEDGWTRNGAIAKALHFFQTGSPDRRL